MSKFTSEKIVKHTWNVKISTSICWLRLSEPIFFNLPHARECVMLTGKPVITGVSEYSIRWYIQVLGHAEQMALALRSNYVDIIKHRYVMGMGMGQCTGQRPLTDIFTNWNVVYWNRNVTKWKWINQKDAVHFRSTDFVYREIICFQIQIIYKFTTSNTFSFHCN